MGFDSAPTLGPPTSIQQNSRIPPAKKATFNRIPQRISGISAGGRPNRIVPTGMTSDKNSGMKNQMSTVNNIKTPLSSNKNNTVVASREVTRVPMVTAIANTTSASAKKTQDIPTIAKIPLERVKLGGTGATGTTTAGIGSQTARTNHQTPGSWSKIQTTATPRLPLQQSQKLPPILGHVNNTGGQLHTTKKYETSHEDLSWMLSTASSAPPPDALKAPIAHRWKCQRKIGSGSFGDTYLAVNVDNGSKVAVKVESVKARHPQLLHEAKILRQMQGTPGFPRLHHFGVHGNQYNVVVMELLGPTLEEVFARWGKRQFQLPTIALLGVQMIDRLEALHRGSYIHRDVKPDNFLIGVGNQTNKVYVIDFGLAKRYRDVRTNAHIPYDDRRSLTGTARYASVNAHSGIEPTRRDDLISTGYALLYFARGGQLPWQGLQARTKEEKYAKIMEKKMNTPLEQLSGGLPDAFTKFLKHCKNLGFEQEPDYNYLRGLLSSIISDTKALPPSTVQWSSKRDAGDNTNRRPPGGHDMLTMFEYGLQNHHRDETKGFPDPVTPHHNENPTHLRMGHNGNTFDPRSGGFLSYFNDNEMQSMRKRMSKRGRGIFCLTCARKSHSTD